MNDMKETEKNECDRLFSRLPPIETPRDLLRRTVCLIRNEQIRSANRRQLALLSVLTVLAAAGMLHFGWIAARDLYLSGFPDFVTLAFTEPSIVLKSGKSLLVGILESLPGISLVVPLAIIFAYLESVRVIVGKFNQSGLTRC
ncbi:hypothetical protein JW899_04655 [Candidatus Uhrbacteria bacterium]|nr:hypothetical protein [Candidatus Uhrbacteria bacterium]